MILLEENKWMNIICEFRDALREVVRGWLKGIFNRMGGVTWGGKLLSWTCRNSKLIVIKDNYSIEIGYIE